MIDIIAVTSYNRGEVLKQCVNSCLTTAPFIPIWIFDDASDDPQTNQILRTFDEQFENIFVFCYPKNEGSNWNNQRALKKFQAKAVENWILIDDDFEFTGEWTQIVEKEFETWDHLYLDNPNMDRCLRGTRHEAAYVVGTSRSTGTSRNPTWVRCACLRRHPTRGTFHLLRRG